MPRSKTTPEGWSVRRYRIALPSKVWEWVSGQATYIGCGESAFVGAMLLLQFQAHERGQEPVAHLCELAWPDGGAVGTEHAAGLEEAGFEF